METAFKIKSVANGVETVQSLVAQVPSAEALSVAARLAKEALQTKGEQPQSHSIAEQRIAISTALASVGGAIVDSV